MSLMSFPGVLNEMDVPKKVQDDVRWLGEPLGRFTKILSQSDIRIHFKEYGLWGVALWLHDPPN